MVGSTLDCSPCDALFTDRYQFTMAYAYWKSNRHNDIAVFDVYFRKNPFNGGFTIFCGIREVENYLLKFKITEENIMELKYQFGTLPDEFLDYLRNVNLDEVTVYSCDEGSIVFPNEPVLTLEGPIAVIQLLETAILNFLNFASLVATNAAHFRNHVRENARLLEFGCRRAQGPNGAMTASVYSYVGGFDSTSNLLAGKKFEIPTSGTMAHSYISSFATSLISSEDYNLIEKGSNRVGNLFGIVEKKLKEVQILMNIMPVESIFSELEAFISYACAFPDEFLATVDTYNIIKSGLVNFCAVALGIYEFGYKAIGIRIDSGDLAYFSRVARTTFRLIAEKYNLPWFSKLLIVVSNDISVDTLIEYKSQDHEIDVFGIGNNLVTCATQSSLGMVYKLVSVNSNPTTKLTEDSLKTTIPYKKTLYRFFDKKGKAIMDFMTLPEDEDITCNKRIEAKHPYNHLKKSFIFPSRIEKMQKIVFREGKIISERGSIMELKTYVSQKMAEIREDYLLSRQAPPYKVLLSCLLYEKFHNLLQSLNPTIEIM